MALAAEAAAVVAEVLAVAQALDPASVRAADLVAPAEPAEVQGSAPAAAPEAAAAVVADLVVVLAVEQEEPVLA